MGTAPVGTHVFVELPLPWPADIALARGFPQDLRVPKDTRVLGFAPSRTDAHPEARRVIRYAAETTGRPRLFQRQESVLQAGEVATAVADLQHDGNHGSGRLAPVRDLFVCGHGRRDSCCGTLGMRAYESLARMTHEDGSVRVWRVSHTGGHRFAPTLIDFPSGRYWGWLGEADLEALLAKDDSEPGRLLDGYRGCALLPPEAQVVERELFARYGWSWDAATKRAEVAAVGEDTFEVTLEYQLPGERLRTASAVVLSTLGPTVLGCGKPQTPQARYTLSDLSLG